MMDDLDLREFDEIPPDELRRRILSILLFVTNTLGFVLQDDERAALNKAINKMKR